MNPKSGRRLFNNATQNVVHIDDGTNEGAGTIIIIAFVLNRTAIECLLSKCASFYFQRNALPRVISRRLLAAFHNHFTIIWITTRKDEIHLRINIRTALKPAWLAPRYHRCLFLEIGRINRRLTRVPISLITLKDTRSFHNRRHRRHITRSE